MTRPRHRRIASLLPSATEIVCAVGLEQDLVAISHSCDFPVSVRGLPVVTTSGIPKDLPGGEIDEMVRLRHSTGQPLYEIDRDCLAAVRPDLILTQGLCDVCAVGEDQVLDQASQLPGNPQVLSLTPHSLADVWRDMRAVARAAEQESKADAVIAALEIRVRRIQGLVGQCNAPKVTVLEWLDPPYACGHWTPELVQLAGGVEGHGRPGARSRRLEWKEIQEWDPDILIVAACGLDIVHSRRELERTENHWGRLRCAREGRVAMVDGNANFSRPGPRLVDSLELLAGLLHPRSAGSLQRHESAIFQA